MEFELREAKHLFESITCLCAEGPEFHTKMELLEAISREATKGFDICKEGLQPKNSADLPGCSCPSEWAFECSFYKSGKCSYRR